MREYEKTLLQKPTSAEGCSQQEQSPFAEADTQTEDQPTEVQPKQPVPSGEICFVRCAAASNVKHTALAHFA